MDDYVPLGFKMVRDDLPIATLIGTHSVSLAIQFWQDKDTEFYAKFVAVLKSPETVPAMEHVVDTCSYNLEVNNTVNLTRLLDGDSTARYSIDTIHFGLTIFEHTWGVRYGFIAETVISTITSCDHAPWPNQIGDYLLDREHAAGCLRFAFVCEYDSLRSFAKQLNELKPDRR